MAHETKVFAICITFLSNSSVSPKSLTQIFLQISDFDFFVYKIILYCRWSIRVLSAVIGMVVIEEGKRDAKVKLLVANHASICDHLAVQLLTDAVTVSLIFTNDVKRPRKQNHSNISVS